MLCIHYKGGGGYMILFSHMTDQLHSVINFNMVGKVSNMYLKSYFVHCDVTCLIRVWLKECE